MSAFPVLSYKKKGWIIQTSVVTDTVLDQALGIILVLYAQNKTMRHLSKKGIFILCPSDREHTFEEV